MDSFEMNKIIGALLATVFIVFSVSILSETIFASPNPATPGYMIEEAEVAGGGGAAAEEPAEEPIAVYLQNADVAAGESLFRRCAACHTDDSGGANKIGPNLWGIVNRPVASHEGFSYSAPMREFAEGGAVVWDYDHLSHFIAAPKALVKGTAMNFAGLKDPQDRANLIAYLRTTADTQEPLPEVPAAGAEAAEGEAPAAGAEGAAPAEGAEDAAPTDGAPAEEAPAEGGAAPAEAPATGAEPTGQASETQPAAPAQPGTVVPEGDAPTANPAAPAEPESGAGAPQGNGGAPAESTDQPPPNTNQPAE